MAQSTHIGKKNPVSYESMLKVVLTIVPMLATAIAAHFSTKYTFELQIAELTKDIEYLKTNASIQFKRLQSDFDRHCKKFELHVARGIDGASHPEGVIQRIKFLENRIDLLEQKLR